MKMETFGGKSNNSSTICSMQCTAGVILIAVGLLIKMFICALLPQTILACLSPQSFIYTVMLERIYLSIDVEFVTLISIIIMVVGIGISLCSADISDSVYSMGSIERLMLRIPNVIVTCICKIIYMYYLHLMLFDLV
jgi:hypothetical protein